MSKTQILYIMQGPSGSGKSTLAKKIFDSQFPFEERNGVINICSTDNYFSKDGPYEFKASELGKAHAWNQERAKRFMDIGDTVIVDNTNIRRWECKPYVEHAAKLGIPVIFIRVTGNFQNIHGVPDEKVEQMRKNMEDLTVESVMASKNPFVK